jgi:RepB plasmid partitioning protein
MVYGTKPDQLVNPKEPKKKTGMTPEEAARMEQEMESAEKDFKAVEAAYTENMMNLTLARTYIKSLLKNAKVIRYLSANHAEFLSGFEDIVASETV